MKLKRATALVCLIAALLSMPAYSSNITVISEGVFSEYTDPDGLLPFAEPNSGTVFSLRFTYDDATPDDLLFSEGGSVDLLPTLGSYNDAIVSMTLTIGSESFQLQPINFIFINNDGVDTQTGGNSDLWVAKTLTETQTGNPGELLKEGFGIIFVESGTLPIPSLTSDDLVVPEWPGTWSLGSIFYNIQLETEVNGEIITEILANANANVSSFTIVPVPAAVWLFGSALGLLGWMRRKTK